MERYYSISEIARRENVKRATVSDLVSKLNIPWIPHPWTAFAKGIDEAGYARIRAAMTSECVTVPT